MTQASQPMAAPTKKDQERLELNLWLQDKTTQRILSQLQRLWLAQLKNSAALGANPAASETLLRSSLTKAATIETIINRIEKGELDESSLL